MNREERIYKALQGGMKCNSLKVENNSHLHKGHLGDDGTLETHYKVTIDCDDLKVISRIGSHKEVKRLLKEEFDRGLHALEIKIIR